MNNTAPRWNFIFRYQPSQNSSDGILLNYLKEQLASVKAEMVLKALRAYWLAEAYQSSNKKRGQDLKQLAQQMIFDLEGQISYLRVRFGIEVPASQSFVLQQLSSSTLALGNSINPPAEEIAVPVIDMDSL